MSLVLGVDVGSQSIKAVIVDERGDVVSSGAAPLTMTHEHDGWAEQDPHAYCTALRDAVRAATRGVQAGRIVAMGLGSQVDGVVACDADGAPLRQAIIWLDKRATKQCDQLVTAVGAELLAERTGLVADASHSAPKMMWIRDNEPQVWHDAAVLAPVGSYVLQYLSGTQAQDAANASSTMVYDVTKGDFDSELCEAAGLDPAVLPPCGRPRMWWAHCAAMSPLISGWRPPARWSSALAMSTPRPSVQGPSSPASSSTSRAPPNR